MIKRLADLRSLSFLIVTLVLQATIVWFGSSLSSSALVALFILNIFAVFTASLINHNHRHCPIFKSAILNFVTNDLLTIAMFAPSTRLHAVHTLNHHAHFQSDKDWCSYRIIKTEKPGLTRSVSYLITAWRNMQAGRKNLRLSQDMSVSLKIERTTLLVIGLTALWLVPTMFLFWLVPSCTLGLLFLLLANLVNHDDCDLNSGYEHSRNFVSPIENFFFFNNGYHTAHHLRPGLHWADYPQMHTLELANRVSPANQQPSFLRYVFKYYFFAGSRLQAKPVKVASNE